MSFNKNGFVTFANFIGSVSGIGLQAHSYVTNDDKASIEAAGYFNEARDLGYIKKGDILWLAGDRDGVPFLSSYVFSAVPAVGGGDVTLTENAAVILAVRVPVLGTASTHYIVCPVAGVISKVLGVSNANGAASTGTVTVTVPTTGAVATLPFVSGYTAGAAVEDTTITEHELAEDAVITVATDGGGDGTGEVIVTLEITPS
jgi:hypothetical protein